MQKCYTLLGEKVAQGPQLTHNRLNHKWVCRFAISAAAKNADEKP